MRTKWAFAILFGILFLAACQARQPRVQTVEVTRLVPQVITIEVPKVVRETQIVTVLATRPPRPTQLVTVLVTQVVKETQIVMVEVTRLVPPTETGATAPPADAFAGVDRGLSLLFARTMHTATRLQDGWVLVAGGTQGPNVELAEVEIYNPADYSWIKAMPMFTARHEHSAALLPDQRGAGGRRVQPGSGVAE